MEKSNLIVALLIDADNAPAKKIDFIMSELANYGSVMVRNTSLGTPMLVAAPSNVSTLCTDQDSGWVRVTVVGFSPEC